MPRENINRAKLSFLSPFPLTFSTSLRFMVPRREMRSSHFTRKRTKICQEILI